MTKHCRNDVILYYNVPIYSISKYFSIINKIKLKLYIGTLKSRCKMSHRVCNNYYLEELALQKTLFPTSFRLFLKILLKW